MDSSSDSESEHSEEEAPPPPDRNPKALFCILCYDRLTSAPSSRETMDCTQENNVNGNVNNPVIPVAGSSRRGCYARRGAWPRAVASFSGRISPDDMVATFCGHMFHKLCLSKCFTTKRTMVCPICRYDISGGSVINVFPSVEDDIPSRSRNASAQTDPTDYSFLYGFVALRVYICIIVYIISRLYEG